jgi:HEPN domain-containing protein
MDTIKLANWSEFSVTKQDIKKLHNFFLSSALRDLKTFAGLKKLQRYDAALFFLHLAIEKNIKALFIEKVGAHAPLSHDLVFLIGRCTVDVSEKILDYMRTISTFNVQTRYENERFDFYKIATKEFALEWEKKGALVLKWIEEQRKIL